MMLPLLAVLSSCNITKFVPADKQLLYKTRIKVEDAKDVTGNDLKTYLRQKHNSEILGFWKLQLHIYNTAPIDTTTKSRARLARNARKMGEAPEIYDPEMTGRSIEHLQKAMQNLGVFCVKLIGPKIYSFFEYSYHRILTRKIRRSLK